MTKQCKYKSKRCTTVVVGMRTRSVILGKLSYNDSIAGFKNDFKDVTN